MAAKFLGEPSKVVTGSHDRTLKIWDLRSRACVETKFAGSSCNDLVTTGTDVSGSTIISGHYDKKIRFWDTRTDCSANEIVLQGKITSLDLSKDCKYLLSCVRDDTIKLLDLRMNQIIKTFRYFFIISESYPEYVFFLLLAFSHSNDNFKVGCDWSRVSFSRDISRIAAGNSISYSNLMQHRKYNNSFKQKIKRVKWWANLHMEYKWTIRDNTKRKYVSVNEHFHFYLLVTCVYCSKCKCATVSLSFSEHSGHMKFYFLKLENTILSLLIHRIH